MLITPRRGGLRGAPATVFCCCFVWDVAPSSLKVSLWSFHAVCVCVFVCGLMSRKKASGGDLRVSRSGSEVVFSSTSCLALVVSRVRGEVFYPLMNWDCWSKVWIIEFLINYPELLSDKSAPLQPPPLLLWCFIWSGLHPAPLGLPFAVLASSTLTLSWRLMLLCVCRRCAFWC